MAEHEAVVAQFHATEVEPRTFDHKDMAGGKEIGDILVHPESNDSRSLDSEGRELPTEEEMGTLRKVADALPLSIFLVAIIELCERFAYYGLTGPFQNYIQNPVPDPSDPDALPGAIGAGVSAATGLVNFFQFFCYITPIIGAIISDQYLGKYNTILYSAGIYMAGLLILWTTALPSSIAHGSAYGGLIAAMIVIGCGTGGIKANVSTLIAEQYTGVAPHIKTLKTGERVIIDPAVTVQRIYMIFYLCINIGSLSPIATTYMEKFTGFWTAFLLCNCVFVVGIVVLVLGKKKYKLRAPQGSVIPRAFKICWIALRNGRNINAAKPGYRAERGMSAVPWNDQFVNEVGRALVACSIFLFFPLYWTTYGQMLSNLVSQAGEMQLHGVPNDFLQNIDPITLIIFIPIFDRLIYPALRKAGIPFKPITRIFFGFVLAAGSMAYAAGVQKMIYNTGPCFDSPGCDAADGGPNNIHVAIQTPAYFLIAISEIFASITGLEYAFTKAPTSMKSFIMSIFLFQSAIGSAIDAALAPVAVDPSVLWMYVGLSIAALLAGIAFWFCFKKYNDTEESMNALEQTGERITDVNEASTHAALPGRNRSVTGDEKTAEAGVTQV